MWIRGAAAGRATGRLLYIMAGGNFLPAFVFMVRVNFKISPSALAMLS